MELAYIPGDKIGDYTLGMPLFVHKDFESSVGTDQQGNKVYIKIAAVKNEQENPLLDWELASACQRGDNLFLSDIFPKVLNCDVFDNKAGGKTFMIARKYQEGFTIWDLICRKYIFPWEQAKKIISYVAYELNTVEDVMEMSCIYPSPAHILLKDASAVDAILLGMGNFRTSNNIDLELESSYYMDDYLAPKMGDVIAPKADVFCLGVTFFQMITGKLPWTDGMPPQLPDDVPTDIADMIYAMISPSWRVRPSLQDVFLRDGKPEVVTSKATSRLIYERPVMSAEDQIAQEEEEHSHTIEESASGDEAIPSDGFKKSSNKGVSPDRDNVVSYDFKKAKKGEGGFKDIAGMEDVKQKLRDDVLFPLRHTQLMKRYGAHPINGMLLVGPQGCGKSYIAEKFAEESGMSFCLVKASDLACTYIHGTQQRMAQLFNQAEDHAPCVICLDEMDAIAPDRSNPRNTAVADSVNELLSQMNNCWERGIFIIGTTNCLDLMDPAVLRKGRLDETIFIPMPDYAARKGMFHLLLSRTLCDDSIHEDELAKATRGYASADIAAIVNKTALQACRKRVRVSMPGLMKAVEATTPSVTSRQLRRFDEMRRQILGQETGPAHIGFR